MSDPQTQTQIAPVKATIERQYSRMGRSSCVVRCTCGHENLFYLWSWAGHGFARCKGCGARISYYTHEVTPAAPKAKVSKRKPARRDPMQAGSNE